MRTNYRVVVPHRGAAPYVGGKKLLAARIIARIEKIPHLCYAEPFVGMGGVFFRRRLVPSAEVINDASRDVATFFRVLQRHFQALGRLAGQNPCQIKPSAQNCASDQTMCKVIDQTICRATVNRAFSAFPLSRQVI